MIGKSEPPNDRLKVSAYDRAASLLVTLLAIVGVWVVGLGIVWFSGSADRANRLRRTDTVRVDNALPDKTVLTRRGLSGGPVLSQTAELAPSQLPEVLASLTKVSARAAIELQANAARESAPTSQAIGDPRARADHTLGPVVREPRREIHFDYADTTQYRRWLDFWRVELAAINRRTNRVDYASAFSVAEPRTHSIDAAQHQENRLYFLSTGTGFEKVDRSLLAKAGIKGQGRIIIQFWPDESSAALLRLEEQAWRAAGKSSLEEVRHTIFRAVAERDGFGWEVEQQLYY